MTAAPIVTRLFVYTAAAALIAGAAMPHHAFTGSGNEVGGRSVLTEVSVNDKDASALTRLALTSAGAPD